MSLLPLPVNAPPACGAASERTLQVEFAFREAVSVHRVPNHPLSPLCVLHPPTHRSGHQGNGKVNVEQLQNLQTVEA